MTFTVETPAALQTKAIADGMNVNKLIYEVWLTPTLGDLTTGAQKLYQKTKDMYKDGGENKTIITLDLVNDQKYTVLLWAQVDGTGVYNTTELNDVHYNSTTAGTYAANDENLAAFYGVAYVDDGKTVKIDGTDAPARVELRRPFAQVNLGTRNTSTETGTTTGYTISIEKSNMILRNVPNRFNVVNGATSVDDEFTEIEFSLNTAPCNPLSEQNENKELPGFDNPKYWYAGMNYVFASNADTGITAELEYNIVTKLDGVSEVVVNNTIPNVPLKENYRTNIVGNLLTSSTDYEVVIDARFNTPDEVVEVVSVSTATELQEAINEIQDGAEGNIKLEGNIDLSALLGATTFAVTKTETARLPIVIPEGKAFTLDLNGFTISTPLKSGSTTDHYYAFENHGTLTIVDSKGEGSINARGNFNYGKMTLESGTITACDGNGGYGVRNYEGAEFVMNGGAIVTSNEDDHQVNNGGYDATTLRVDEGASAIINGGNINNICDYTFALDNYGTVTVNGGMFTSIHSTVSTYGTMTINGGSFACNGIEGITAHCLVTWDGSETTINGGTFDGKDNYNGFNVDACKGSVVNIKGGKFLSVHSGSLYGEGAINVTGGEFFDDPSKRVADDCVAVKDETANVYNVVEAYAKVGETKYTSLNAAFTEALKLDEATIVVLRDTEMDAVNVEKGKTITLNLNGKTVTDLDTATAHYALITNNGTLNVAGPGAMKVSATNNRGWNAYSSVLSNATNGTLTVTGEAVIEHLGGTDMAYGLDNLTNSNIGDANATIDGATIKSTYRAIRQFLNCDSKENNLTVKSGSVIIGANKSIWMQDPSKKANNGQLVVEEGAELYGDVYLNVTAGSEEWPVSASIPASTLKEDSEVVTANVPAGYSVENVGGVWQVIKWTSVATADELVAALAAGEDVLFANDITVAATKGGYNKAGILQNTAQTIDGNGYTLTVTGAGALWDCAIYTNGGTIKNLTVAGPMRGIFTAGLSTDLYIDNVEFKDVIYTFNSDGKEMPDNPFGVYVSNSIVNGWTSHSNIHTEVVYTNCTFGEGSGYKYCRPYGKTSFVECTFCSGYTVDESNTNDITYTNCVFN